MDETKQERPPWAERLAGADATLGTALDAAIGAALRRRIPNVRAPVSPAEVVSALEDAANACDLANGFGEELVARVRESARERAASSRPTTYPAPDRRNFTPNQFTDDEALPERDHGGTRDELADGRPAVVELWYSEGFMYVTVFFSVLDLEGASMAELLTLLSPVLRRARVPMGPGDNDHPGLQTLQDGSGNWVYSITFVRSAPDW